MIIEQQKEAIILQEGLKDSDTIEMSLDLESSAFIMQMLSKNLYQEPISSTIREICSNALDSHRKLGINKPIIVSLLQDDKGNWEFSVQDEGIGMDDEDVKNIISQYGKSTKRSDNQAIGCFGLGFKAGLSYSSHFFFIARKNGVERKYMMYEGEDKNSIDLLYTINTEECNGVKVVIPVDRWDVKEFKQKIQEQLCYFDSVYFNVDGIDNEFIITRTEDFQISSLCGSEYMHISLDNVYYPIDWKALGVDRIEFPVALRFSLTDGIIPNPARESIKYTKTTIELIKNKISKVADFFVNLHNETTKETSNPLDVWNFFRSNDRYVSWNEKKWWLNPLLSFSKVSISNPKLIGIDKINPYQFLKSFNTSSLLEEYEIVNYVHDYKWRECKHKHQKEIDIYRLSDRKVILCTERPKGALKEYIKETFGKRGWSNACYIVKKTHPFKLGNKDGNSCYYNFLKLWEVPKSQWREKIQEFQKFVEMFTSDWVNVDKIVIPEEWLEARKKARTKAPVSKISVGRRVKLSGEISVNKAEQLQRYVSGKNCKWVRHVWKLEEIYKHKSLIVYGGETNLQLMDELFGILNGYKQKNKITLIQLSDKELKIVKETKIHNLISMEEFMTGKNMPFKRLITAYLINDLICKNRNIFERTEQMEIVSKDLGEKCELLETYRDNNYVMATGKIYDAMLEMATTNNLFDYSIYPTYLHVKKILDELEFLNVLFEHISYRSDKTRTLKMFKCITDLCKYYKFKMNWDNYTLPLAEEVAEEPILEAV